LTRNNSEDGSKQVIQQEQVFVTTEILNSTAYHVHIDDYIGGLDYYRPLQSIFNSTSENDTIVIHLSSPGGDLNTALVVVGWLKNADAHTVCILEGTSASAASLFVMSVDSVFVMPHSCLMLHSASYGYVNDQQRVKKFVDFSDEYLINLYKDFYDGFLSEEEINSMINSSQEIWLTADEVIERLQAREDNRQEVRMLEEGQSFDDIVPEKPKRKPRKKNKEVSNA